MWMLLLWSLKYLSQHNCQHHEWMSEWAIVSYCMEIHSSHPNPKDQEFVESHWDAFNWQCTFVGQAIVKTRCVENNCILSQHQSAFREKHSCDTSLNFVLNNIQQCKSSGKKIFAIFLDLKRAFETVDRSIVLDILKRYGIGGSVLKWFTSWLTNRKQFTRFCGVVQLCWCTTRHPIVMSII